MKKIAIITATRAEYGLLSPLIRRVLECESFEMDLIVTGGHLSERQGKTISEIRADGFPITHEIPILEDGDTPYDISLTMSNALKGFAKCFKKNRPDLVVILGDRTEMLAVASAAMNELIPIAHINGGDVTEGAVDDCVRHALTKMSYLHFTTCEAYRNRVIQLGEEPKRVFNVGSLSVENIMNETLLSREALSASIGFELSGDYAVVTYHPATLETGIEMCVDTKNKGNAGINVLLSALEVFPELKLLITKANTDTGGQQINEQIDDYVVNHQKRCRAVYSLGKVRYLSALKHATLVIGNSSSGITETPSFGVPTVNVGDRQRGRIRADNVIDCTMEKEAIISAVQTALSDTFKAAAANAKSPYGDGKTSEKIVTYLKQYLNKDEVNLKKHFYDVPVRY